MSLYNKNNEIMKYLANSDNPDTAIIRSGCMDYVYEEGSEEYYHVNGSRQRL